MALRVLLVASLPVDGATLSQDLQLLGYAAEGPVNVARLPARLAVREPTVLVTDARDEAGMDSLLPLCASRGDLAVLGLVGEADGERLLVLANRGLAGFLLLPFEFRSLVVQLTRLEARLADVGTPACREVEHARLALAYARLRLAYDDVVAFCPGQGHDGQ